MSITNSALVRDALGLIGVLTETESASAEQIQHGIRILNELMASWVSDGIDLQYYPQTEAGDTTPIPDDDIAAVKHFLGFSLAPYYGRTISPEMVAVGESHYARLTRNAVNEQITEVRVSRPQGEGAVFLGRILTG